MSRHGRDHTKRFVDVARAMTRLSARPTRRWLKVKRKDRTVAEDGWRRRISSGL